MTCYYPLKAYRIRGRKNLTGKDTIVFDKKKLPDFHYEEIKLKCSQCFGCRMDRSADWAIRCVHEAKLYGQNNCFLTLTFNDENMSPTGSLVKKDFVNFMKRLRRKFNGKIPVKDQNGKRTYPIRFFHCGEYGSDLSRPHHHACIFNFDFPDKTEWDCRGGNILYRSEALERLWSKEILPSRAKNYKKKNNFSRHGKTYTKLGFANIGSVTYSSAAYVARYITKKVNGDMAKEHYKVTDLLTGERSKVQPEYITMSRRAGIAKQWFDKFKTDVYPKDFVTEHGIKFRPPRYYDKLYETESPEEYAKIKERRGKKNEKNADNNTKARLAVRELVARAKCKQLGRVYECS